METKGEIGMKGTLIALLILCTRFPCLSVVALYYISVRWLIGEYVGVLNEQ